ncbi:hypothetical protein [Propionibacterium sp.]|uniref:hypothetical protein n=1 Tax=Propionibacterium sp. TaxID=1977903 RepID=UPI0039E80A5A
MGLTGLIWLAIVAGWLAYLVPRFAWHKGAGAAGPAARPDFLADSMRVIRPCKASFSRDVDPELHVSTPLQREAVFFQVRRASQIAARRRRLGLVGSFALALAGVLVAVLTPAPWWLAVVGFVLLVGFVVLSRISVHTVDAMIDDRLASVYEEWNEDTVCVVADDLGNTGQESAEISVELDEPMNSSMASLLEPLAVTPPTYVSKPLLPRSVRTIDLTHPVPLVAQPGMPVLAERPETQDGAGSAGVIRLVKEDIDSVDLPRAVGE